MLQPHKSGYLYAIQVFIWYLILTCHCSWSPRIGRKDPTLLLERILCVLREFLNSFLQCKKQNKLTQWNLDFLILTGPEQFQIGKTVWAYGKRSVGSIGSDSSGQLLVEVIGPNMAAKRKMFKQLISYLWTYLKKLIIPILS